LPSIRCQPHEQLQAAEELQGIQHLHRALASFLPGHVALTAFHSR
jgi:hypothetical protein